MSTSSSPRCNHRNSLHLSTENLAFSGAFTGSVVPFLSMVSMSKAHATEGRKTGTSIADGFEKSKASSNDWPASSMNTFASLGLSGVRLCGLGGGGLPVMALVLKDSSSCDEGRPEDGGVAPSVSAGPNSRSRVWKEDISASKIFRKNFERKGTEGDRRFQQRSKEIRMQSTRVFTTTNTRLLELFTGAVRQESASDASWSKSWVLSHGAASFTCKRWDSHWSVNTAAFFAKRLR